MKKKFFGSLACGLFLLSLAAYGGKKLAVHLGDKELNDLPQILENRYYRVLTSRNAFDYHVYQGRPRGYQYELIKAFTDKLNKKYRKKGLKIQFELIPADYDQLIPMLLQGKGDLVAANLTATKERKELVDFTLPLRETKELLVTRSGLKDENPFLKKIALRKSSSYYESVKRWNQENEDNFFFVRYVDETLTPESIMELLSKGVYDYTLIDSYLYEIGKKVYPSLAKATVQPFADSSSLVGIAVRKNSPKLLAELNEFIPTVGSGSRLGNIIDAKYFNDAVLLATKQNPGGALSPYDDLLKKYAQKYDWDWRLLAALCFQESRFNQNIVNRWGAIGLFQVKQSTANEPYVGIKKIRGPKRAENNIHAGVKYLSWIRDNHFPDLPPRRRIRMSLAAYNAGPTTVIRARKRAKKLGLDPDIWFRNVELAMTDMRKSEPVNYVSEINKRYVSYSLLLEGSKGE